MRLSPYLWLSVALSLLSACRPLPVPATQAPAAGPNATPSLPPFTPIIQCTAPLCAPGEVFFCPGGDCPGGCGTGCATSTSSPDAATPTLRPMCTPPACWSDEAYFCPGECPGGCGTICATRTPDPNASPTPTFPAPGAICALPQLSPGISGDTPEAVFRCASAESIAVGETVQILAQAVGIPEARYIVEARDAEGFGFVRVELTGENRLRLISDASRVVRLVSAQASGGYVLVALEGLAPGSLEVAVSAGPLLGPVVSAEALTLTVTP